MRMLGLLFSLLILFSSSIVCSDTVFEMITDLGSSARMISLGGIEGFGRSAASVFDNPAALYRVRRQSYSLFHTQFLNGEVTVMNVAAAVPIHHACLAVGAYHSSVSDIPFTQRSTSQSEEIYVAERFNYDNAIYKLGYQFFWADVSCGIGLSFLSQSLYKDLGTGMNVDFGMLGRLADLDWSFIVKNLLLESPVTYQGSNSEGMVALMPQQFSLGIRKSLDDFSLYTQFKYHQSVENFLKSFAVEYHPVLLSLPVSASIGWQEFASVGAIYQKFTVGIGIVFIGTSVFFAFEQSDFLSQDHQYYLSVNFSML